MEHIFKWLCGEFITEVYSSERDYIWVVRNMANGGINATFLDACIDADAKNETTRSYTVLETSLIATITTFLSLATIIGNVLVMVSFKMDKRLQTVNNYFLLSLAVADFNIGLFSMPLNTTYTLMEGWTLGPVVCDLWLALDYLCSNASVLNLLMISFDRYFSVTNPLRYRAKRNSRLAAIMIACAWVLSFLTWPPWIFAWPYIEGQRTVPEDRCFIQFLETNSYITVITALIAFYVPVIVMCVLYYKIWRETENRKQYLAEMIAENEQSIDQSNTGAVENEADQRCPQRFKNFLINLCNIDCDDGNEDDSASPGATTPSSAETPIQSSRTTSVSLRPEQLVCIKPASPKSKYRPNSPTLQEDKSSKQAAPPSPKVSIYNIIINIPPSKSEIEHASITEQFQCELPATPAPMRSSLSTSALMAQSVTNANLKRCSSSDVLNTSRLVNLLGKQGRLSRPNLKKKTKGIQEKKHDRKAARTLSAILLAFIITWTPYNVLVLVKSVETFLSCENIIPQVLWDFAYYLCYLNSTINPVCYALANANFRKTYWRILTCTWRKESKLSIIRGMHSKAS